jgi:hypothetical protein
LTSVRCSPFSLCFCVFSSNCCIVSLVKSIFMPAKFYPIPNEQTNRALPQG